MLLTALTVKPLSLACKRNIPVCYFENSRHASSLRTKDTIKIKIYSYVFMIVFRQRAKPFMTYSMPKWGHHLRLQSCLTETPPLLSQVWPGSELTKDRTGQLESSFCTRPCGGHCSFSNGQAAASSSCSSKHGHPQLPRSR